MGFGHPRFARNAKYGKEDNHRGATIEIISASIDTMGIAKLPCCKPERAGNSKVIPDQRAREDGCTP